MSDLPVISARGVCKSYPESAGSRAVIRDLDLDIHAGEIVAILGRSGSGKTTLLNLIGAMDRPTHGHIEYGNREMSTWSDAERTSFRRTRLGFVFQSFNLLPTLTVRENIALPLELNGLPLDERIDRLLDTLGLGSVAERFPDQIAGGEQQRAAIARAVVHKPALIIADEPTGNLDLETGREVIGLFEHCVREVGAALIMATHSLEMRGSADRVFELRNGSLTNRSVT